MDTSIPTADTSLEDVPEVLEDQPSQSEMARAIQLAGIKASRDRMHANEVALKGFYVDFLFNRLNLNKYR